MPTVSARGRLRDQAEEHAKAASAARGQAERNAMIESVRCVHALLAISHALEALRLEIQAGSER